MQNFPIFSVFDICAIVILVVVLITLIFRKILKSGVDRYLIGIVVVMLLTAIFDFVTQLFGTLIPARPELYWLCKFSYYAYFFLRNLHAPIYILYIVKASDTWNLMVSRKAAVIIGTIPLIVNTVTLCLNPITHQIFTVNSNFFYTDGSGIIIQYLCNGLYMAMGISLLVSYKKLFRRDKFVALVAMYPINITAVTIQALTGNILIEMLAISLAILCIVMTLRDEEGMRDPILGVMNYRSFDADMRRILFVRKPVNIILVNVLNWKSVYSILGNENSIVLLRRLKKKFEEISKQNKFDQVIYYLEQGFFAIIDSKASPEDAQAAAEAIDEYILEDTVVNQIFMELNSAICCVKCPDDFEKYPAFLKFVEDFRKYITDTKGVAFVKDIINDNDFILKNELPEIIANAIMNRSFSMFYQPIYSPEKKSFVAIEAFIRLKTEKYGYIPPALFIAEAEKSGAIHQIWDIIIDDICRFVSKNELKVIGFERIDINISEVQFMETDFSEKLEKALRKYKVSPSMIAFELKETAIMNEQPAFLRNIKRLDALGIKFALDDYGTGTSNICRISQMPVSVIKMDREFITKTANEMSSGILKNTISLIKESGMKPLAEGVEDEKTANMLIEMGCDYLQGYYYSKPLSAEDFMNKFHSISADELF